MTGRKKGPKANVHGAKPEPPPFIARMREQIVAREDEERRERSEKRRHERGTVRTDEEDEPKVVKLNQDDISEEEYKRMKEDLETRYKLDERPKRARAEELDIDAMIESRTKSGDRNRSAGHHGASSSSSSSKKQTVDKSKTTVTNEKKKNNKKLSYGSSSEEDN